MNRFTRNTTVAALQFSVDAAHFGACHHSAFRRLARRVLAGAVVAMLVADARFITASAMIKVSLDFDTIGIELCAAINH